LFNQGELFVNPACSSEDVFSLLTCFKHYGVEPDSDSKVAHVMQHCPYQLHKLFRGNGVNAARFYLLGGGGGVDGRETQ
jgi:hypothetical protein